MKTLIKILICSFILLNVANAQFSENFENPSTTSLTGNCWLLEQVGYTSSPGEVISGSGSYYTNPPTSGSGERTLATPYLNMTSPSVTISFNYKISSKIANNATRTINIGIRDKNGVFTSFQVITLDKTTPTTVFNQTATYTIPAIGVYRMELRIGGATGDGNSRVIFDDLSVNATPVYGPVNHCNTPAVAVNDTYTVGTISAYSDNVLSNDNFPPDGEMYSAVLVTAPTTGTLVLNADGTFTYTPDQFFTGGVIIFTYKVVDNGAPVATSNIATVTIIYSIPVILPVKIIEFNASIEDGKVAISWVATENNTGEYFVVEKSTDGKSFSSVQQVSVAQVAGTKEYKTADWYSGRETFYRLKIVNKDGSVTYSVVVLVKDDDSTGRMRVKGTSVQTTLNVEYISSGTANATLTIYSVNGAKVLNSIKLVNGGTNLISVNVNNVNSGVYILVLDSGTIRKAIKFIKS